MTPEEWREKLATAQIDHPVPDAPLQLLGRTQAEEFLGFAPNTLANYKFPAPDAVVGKRMLWSAKTLEAWGRLRPRTVL